MGPRRVAVVGYTGAELLDIACVTSTLAMAGRLAGRDLYDVELLTTGGRDISCDAGMVLGSSGSLHRATGSIDTLIVAGGDGHERAASDPILVAHVRRLAADSRRVASVCTGASVLAAAGLLDGLPATTHWRFARQFARRFPAVQVDPDPIYIRHGRIATSGGVTSALDLTLSFVAEDHGESLARGVARDTVTYLHRPGNQAQMSMFVTAPAPEHELVRAATEYISAHAGDRLDVAVLAERFDISRRQLTRLFVEHVGETPGRHVRRIRTQAAARLLSSSSLSVTAVAQRTGFGTAEALRQAFVQRYGLAPSRYRLLHTPSD